MAQKLFNTTDCIHHELFKSCRKAVYNDLTCSDQESWKRIWVKLFDKVGRRNVLNNNGKLCMVFKTNIRIGRGSGTTGPQCELRCIIGDN